MTAAMEAGIGHNKPPSLIEQLGETYVDEIKELDEVAKRADEAPKEVKSDADVATVGDIAKDARKLFKELDKHRDNEGRPHLTAKREIDGFFKVHLERLSHMMDVLEARATAYQRRKLAEARAAQEAESRRLREEEDRQREIARQEAERNRPNAALKHVNKAEDLGERAEIAEAAATVSNADLTRVRSESGTVVGSRTEWKGEILSMDEIDLDKLRPFLKREDVQKALNTYVRMGNRTLTGARIFEDVKANFR
ncbi:hypothetical protein [Microvirga brassicacearum]|uniref:Uncharacterized protein n=1 Tax=Microvirga brassicacearum TaxID=2580413 RepID=A0A5N3PH35_9HYPH|nr:hypothetical protein [Microvirga brassicacearum]KAB0269020.1 hypothetical protein FEZ63_02620 [Microvirga brassicacearum]